MAKLHLLKLTKQRLGTGTMTYALNVLLCIGATGVIFLCCHINQVWDMTPRFLRTWLCFESCPKDGMYFQEVNLKKLKAQNHFSSKSLLSLLLYSNTHGRLSI
jgi:hypothetical protein